MKFCTVGIFLNHYCGGSTEICNYGDHSLVKATILILQNRNNNDSEWLTIGDLATIAHFLSQCSVGYHS